MAGAVVAGGNGATATGSLLLGAVMNCWVIAKPAAIKRSDNPDRIAMRLSMASHLALSPSAVR